MKIQSCRSSLVIEQSISADVSLFSYPGSMGANPTPHQALELHNCLTERRLYLQGLLTT